MPQQWKVKAWVAFGATLALFAFAPEILGWAVEQESGWIERAMLLGLVAGFGLGASWLWKLARARQTAYGRLGPLTVYLMLVACNALAKGAGYGVIWVGGFVSQAASSDTGGERSGDGATGGQGGASGARGDGAGLFRLGGHLAGVVAGSGPPGRLEARARFMRHGNRR